MKTRAKKNPVVMAVVISRASVNRYSPVIMSLFSMSFTALQRASVGMKNMTQTMMTLSSWCPSPSFTRLRPMRPVAKQESRV